MKQPEKSPELWEDGGFALYVHWPFCAAKCPYCDFNSHVAKAAIAHDQWARAFEMEIARYGSETRGRTLDSIFFGGGTPSLMDPQVVSRVIDAAQRQWRFRNSIEITLEANPGSVEQARFLDFAGGGVNRVSLGIQALNDHDLKKLGRLHSARAALRAWEVARNTFDRASFDLIYARQDQSLDDWHRELREAIRLEPSHLSLYQLTIEDGTAFGRLHAQGRLTGLPDEDLGADMFDVTQEICAAHGLPAYEISNHAAPGQESVHNQVYWRSGDYIGIGPGAHGRLTLEGKRYAIEQAKLPARWLDAVLCGSKRHETRRSLTEIEHAREFVIMGLRLASGLDLRRLYQLVDGSVFTEPVQRLQEFGLVFTDGKKFACTQKGRPLLNSILSELTREL